MSNRHIDWVKHTKEVQMAGKVIGLDRKRPFIRDGKWYYRPHQNRYCCPNEDKISYLHLMTLVDCGYAEKSRKYPGGTMFRLTKYGMEWLGMELGIVISEFES